MTLLEMEGLLFEYISNRDAIGRRRARQALFQGLQEVRETARDAGSDRLDATDLVDLVADKNMYPLPSQVGEVRYVERLDQGSNARPLTRIPPRERHNSTVKGTNGYFIAGTDLVLLFAPAVSAEDGLRIVHLPNIPDDAPDNWVPPFPTSTHEPAVAKALLRLSGRGAALVAPKEAQTWMALQERRLINFLYPDGRDAQRPIRAGIDFYTPER
jgi:hypothetical protein